MNEGRISEDGRSVLFGPPELEGVMCEIQHGSASPDTIKPITEVPGTLGAGVLILPSGQPRVVIQLKHPDGTSLGCVLDAASCRTVLECIIDAGVRAQQICDEAKAAQERAS